MAEQHESMKEIVAALQDSDKGKSASLASLLAQYQEKNPVELLTSKDEVRHVGGPHAIHCLHLDPAVTVSKNGRGNMECTASLCKALKGWIQIGCPMAGTSLRPVFLSNVSMASG